MKHRILAVSPQPCDADLFGRATSMNGYEVEFVPSGEVALRRIAEAPKFDCIVTEYSLPGMDGIELVKHVRKQDADIGVVIVTGHFDPLCLEEMCDGLGVWAVVPKMDDPELIASKIASACDLAGLGHVRRSELLGDLTKSIMDLRRVSASDHAAHLSRVE